jgi:hypothetical protein
MASEKGETGKGGDIQKKAGHMKSIISSPSIFRSKKRRKQNMSSANEDL